MPAPTIKGTRTNYGTGSSISIEPPAGLAAGDTLLAIVQTPNHPITWPAGWTEIQATGTGTAGAAGSSRLSVAIRQVTTSSSGDWWLDLNTTGFDHTHIVYVLLSGCVVDTSAAQVNGASYINLAPAVTTTVNDALVLAIGGHAVDVSWTVYEGWVNSDLSSFGRVIEFTRPDGVGGGIGLFSGTRATAGAIGQSTLTMYDEPSTNIASIGVTVALIEPPPPRISYGGGGAVATAAAGASSTVVAWPSYTGTAGKRRLEVLAMSWRGSVAPTVDAIYWTLAVQSNTGNTTNNGAGSTPSGAIYVRESAADASAPSSGQRTISKISGSSRAQCKIAVWETDDEMELDVASASVSGSSATSATHAGLTTSEADELLIAVPIGARNVTLTSFVAATGVTTASGATDTVTPPSADAWTERFEHANATNPTQSLSLVDAIKTTAGSTGTMTAQFSAGAARHAILAAAFRRKSAAPPSVEIVTSYLIH